jgi:hypothetical protein
LSVYITADVNDGESLMVLSHFTEGKGIFTPERMDKVNLIAKLHGYEIEVVDE